MELETPHLAPRSADAALRLPRPGAAARAPAARALAVALLLGWGADFLFWGQRPGLGAPLFTALILVGLFFLARLEGLRPAWRNLWILAPLLFFATMVAVRANELLTVLNILAVVLLLTVVATYALAGRLHHLGVMGYPLVLLRVALEATFRPAPATAALVREGLGRRPRAVPSSALRRAVPVLRGVFLAAPLLLLFTALLSAADSIFAEYVADVFAFWSPPGLPDLSEPLGHLTLILSLAWLLAGGLLFALRRGAAQGEDALAAPIDPPLRIGFVEGATVLVLVDALFAAFVLVQFAYLFSGQAAATMHFEEFRDYARQGFFELVVVTVLCLGMILSLRWLTSRPTPRRAFALNALCSLTVGLALVMLASALQRLMAWESVEYYINSPTRLYVRTFIIWLAMTYGWLLLTLWLRHDRFAVGACVAALGFLVTVNLLNPDADTARANLARHDDLATRFVWVLSDDAVPALAAGLDAVEGGAREDLRAQLSRRLEALERAGPDDWRSLHLARWRARDTLLALRAAGTID
jgi:Domain of unknown function (DUF4173)